MQFIDRQPSSAELKHDHYTHHKRNRDFHRPCSRRTTGELTYQKFKNWTIVPYRIGGFIPNSRYMSERNPSQIQPHQAMTISTVSPSFKTPSSKFQYGAMLFTAVLKPFRKQRSASKHDIGRICALRLENKLETLPVLSKNYLHDSRLAERTGPLMRGRGIPLQGDRADKKLRKTDTTTRGAHEPRSGPTHTAAVRIDPPTST